MSNFCAIPRQLGCHSHFSKLNDDICNSIYRKETWNMAAKQSNPRILILTPEISDHQQSLGYEDGPWKGPGPPLLVAADLSLFINRRHRSGLHPSSMPSR
jgi:hypothetical protein